MKKVQDEAPQHNTEQQEWLDVNLKKQNQRYDQIVSNMDALSEQRDSWIKDFLFRIQNYGFNYNCDAKRKIPDSELPEKIDRPFKVVY
ncbi:MAG: hypothetical protein VYA80_01515 [Pseudomonadota bacterium]|nr:hypothetical protein [Pseudomonadota bacterium]